MKTNWKMPRPLRPAFEHELQLYRANLLAGHIERAWRQLERAHILRQPWAIEHTRVHWLMLRFGFRIKNFYEFVGQIPRLLIGGVKSFVGQIPIGNTGGANVSTLKHMKLPEDVAEMLNAHNRRS